MMGVGPIEMLILIPWSASSPNFDSVQVRDGSASLNLQRLPDTSDSLWNTINIDVSSTLGCEC